ncbi:MAG: hypothetical protein IKU10_02600 [Clostridia bacterium]|nr:hypothetical protein [Clostridia bacterium]
MQKVIAGLVLLALLLCGCSSTVKQPHIVVKNLEIPTLEQYPEDFVSRCPWDLAIWNNKLYVGAGDYGANTGPVDCMAYNLQTATWENSGTVLEESIARFCVVNDTLMIPGIDSTGDSHLLGEYYSLQEDKWQLNRTLPGGIHCFDLVEYNNQLFAGLGVTRGEYPVAVSSDNGETFTQVPFYKDGNPIKTTKDAIRVYDLFVMKQTLYAVYIAENNEAGASLDFECSFYRFEGDRFVYETTWDPCYETIGATQIPFAAKEVFGDRLFVATGYLYRSDDHLSFEKVPIQSGVTLDLLQYENTLYALNNTPCENGTFDISVWCTTNGETFEQVLCFNHQIPALSFAKNDETFYIGIGNPSLQYQANGTILSVTYS